MGPNWASPGGSFVSSNSFQGAANAFVTGHRNGESVMRVAASELGRFGTRQPLRLGYPFATVSTRELAVHVL
jgi:hypothetical protein